MHATSLQGFDYGDVVHQFEKRCMFYGRCIQPPYLPLPHSLSPLPRVRGRFPAPQKCKKVFEKWYNSLYLKK
ncbi:MAG: hypothetical protein MGU50_05640 [Trichodesmium sp. MAG_R02]|nr:hypothetical protein [Trichodesmium sp. MAG_R02]